MATIAVDIDDTLSDFGSLAQEMMTKVSFQNGKDLFKRGAYSPWNEWRTPADLFQDEWQEVIDMCHQDHVIRQQIPYKNSVSVLQKIASAGNKIIYITNRNPNAHDATYNWLKSHGFPQPEGLICTLDSKAPYIEEAQYLIDDRPKTLVEFTYDHGWKLDNDPLQYGSPKRKSFGLLCEYNRALTDVPGIYLAPNWALLERYIKEKGDGLIERDSASLSSTY